LRKEKKEEWKGACVASIVFPRSQKEKGRDFTQVRRERRGKEKGERGKEHVVTQPSRTSSSFEQRASRLAEFAWGLPAKRGKGEEKEKRGRFAPPLTLITPKEMDRRNGKP